LNNDVQIHCSNKTTTPISIINAIKPNHDRCVIFIEALEDWVTVVDSGDGGTTVVTEKNEVIGEEEVKGVDTAVESALVLGMELGSVVVNMIVSTPQEHCPMSFSLQHVRGIMRVLVMTVELERVL
jgi:hypothetical protein